MAFYIDKEKMYLEMHVRGAGLRVSLLQGTDGMWFPKTKTPDNAAL